MRNGLVLAALATATALAGCARPPGPVPEVVAVKVAPADMARYRAMAAACGTVSTRTETIGEATLLFVGKDSPVAARDCFYEQARADYHANHPIRAWVEDRIG